MEAGTAKTADWFGGDRLFTIQQTPPRNKHFSGGTTRVQQLDLPEMICPDFGTLFNGGPEFDLWPMTSSVRREFQGQIGESENNEG